MLQIHFNSATILATIVSIYLLPAHVIHGATIQDTKSDNAEQPALIDITESKDKTLGEEQGRYSRNAGVKLTDVQCENQGGIPIVNECTKYYACSRAGVPATLSKCPTRKFFHHQMRTCLQIKESECLESMCQSTEQKLADPYNRENYLICRHMYPEVKRCPDGQLFDPSESKCVVGSAMDDLRDPDDPDDYNDHKALTDQLLKNAAELFASKMNPFSAGSLLNSTLGTFGNFGNLGSFGNLFQNQSFSTQITKKVTTYTSEITEESKDESQVEGGHHVLRAGHREN